VEEVSPLGDDTLAEEPPPPDTRRPGGAPMTEEVSPRPSETPPPAEGPPGAERRTGNREYFTDLIRETDRRSRGQI